MNINHIALIGSPNSVRHEVALLLGNVTNFKIVSIVPENFTQLKGINFDTSPTHMEQLLLGLSFFHENVVLEKKDESFISDGSVLNGYLLIRTMSLLQSSKKHIKVFPESIYDEFEHRLIKVIGDYMKATYNYIYFLPSSNSKRIEKCFDKIFEEIFLDLSNKIGLKYLSKTDATKCIVDQIIKDIN